MTPHFTPASAGTSAVTSRSSPTRLRSSAVCPKPGKKEGPLGKCEKTYYDMLSKAEF